MPFKGTLKWGTPALVEVTASGGNAGGTSVTIAKVVKQDRYTDVDAITAAPGAVGTANVSITNAVQRLIVSIHPPIGGTAQLRVSQGGGNQFEDQINGDIEFVYDLVP